MGYCVCYSIRLFTINLQLKNVKLVIYVWWVEELTLLGDLKCVVMEYGVECVTDSNIGVQKMPELHVVNLGFSEHGKQLHNVMCSFKINNCFCLSL